METGGHILLLAGSAEARVLAARLLALGFEVSALKTEPPKSPEVMPVPWVLLEEVSVVALSEAMAGAVAVLDASNGFDAGLRAAGVAAARGLGLPFLSLTRPAWGLEAAHWRRASDVAAAMAFVPAGARVFATTGWGSLPGFEGFPGARVFLRQTQEAGRVPPFDFVEVVFGTPPFSAAQEQALFEQLRISLLMCRNIGGAASRPKLEAAKALGLPVILIDKPPLPEGVQVVKTVEAALDWVQAL